MINLEPRMPVAAPKTPLTLDCKSGTEGPNRNTDSDPAFLSALEERKLAERIKAGDRLAQEQLVLAYRPLVFRVVRECQYKTLRVSREDLIQEGSVGLIRAAQNFDPSTHTIRFFSYARYWIRAFVQRAIFSDDSLVRLPEHTRLLRERYLRTLRELATQGPVATESASEISPDAEPIGAHAELSFSQIELSRKAIAGRGLCDSVDSSPAALQTAESDLVEHEERAAVHAALRKLSPFEAWVIRERFGLGRWCPNPIDSRKPKNKGAPSATVALARRRRRARTKKTAQPSAAYYSRTHDKLSRDCGLSVHRVRQVEKAALDKLRYFLGRPVPHGRQLQHRASE